MELHCNREKQTTMGDTQTTLPTGSYGVAAVALFVIPCDSPRPYARLSPRLQLPTATSSLRLPKVPRESLAAAPHPAE